MRKLLILGCFLFCFQCALGVVITTQNTAIYQTPGNNEQPVTNLQSGSQVTLLKTNLQNGYSLVKTASGQQGWLLTGNLSQQQAAKKKTGFFARIWADIAHKKDSTIATAATQSNMLNTAQAKQTNTQATTKQTTKAVVTQKLKTSENTVVANKPLAQQVMQLQQQVASLQAEQHNQWYWFIWGALVAFIALFIGLFLGRRKQKQRARSLFH